MGSISVNEITIKLNPSEAIDVGHAILRNLEDTVSNGYDLNMNHKGMLELCKQVLNTAYGYDYSSEIDRRIQEAKKAQS